MKKKFILKKKAVIPVTALIIALAAAGCGNTASSANSETTVAVTEANTSVEASDKIQTTLNETDETDEAETAASLVSANSDIFSDRDLDSSYDEAESIKISLEGSSATCTNSSVNIDGSSITITAEGTYIISGTLDDGMIIVDVADTEKVQLVLDDADITSSTSAAIYVKQADKVFVTLADGSENSLANGGEFAAIDDNNIDAVIFSKEDLTLNGNGTLVINSPAGHGIVSKDSLRVTGGTYEIKASSHGLNGKDDVSIAAGSFNITSGKDGIHSENTEDTEKGYVYIEGGSFVINAEGDGISGEAYVQLEDGDFDITSGGGNENGEAHTNNMGGPGGMNGNGGPGGMGGNGGPGGMSGNGGPRGNGGMGGHGMTPPDMQSGVDDSATYTSLSLDSSNTDEDALLTSGDAQASTESTDNAILTSGDAQAFEESTDTTDSNSVKGIKSTGDLIINGGSYNIDSADDALHSNANITVNRGDFTISTGDDGFHADATLTVNGGTINIETSYEGFEGLDVVVNDGDITLNATDDGINAAGGNDQSGFGGFGGDMFGSSGNSSVVINGGNLDITAYGDGLDSNGSLEITGGYIKVTGPTTGDTATLDYDSTGTISGGTFIGTGAAGMAQSLTGDGQGVIALNAGSVSAGTVITVTDENGNEVISFTPELDYNVVIISSEDIVSGATYTLTTGSESQTVTAS